MKKAVTQLSNGIKVAVASILIASLAMALTVTTFVCCILLVIHFVLKGVLQWLGEAGLGQHRLIKSLAKWME